MFPFLRSQFKRRKKRKDKDFDISFFPPSLHYYFCLPKGSRTRIILLSFIIFFTTCRFVFSEIVYMGIEEGLNDNYNDTHNTSLLSSSTTTRLKSANPLSSSLGSPPLPYSSSSSSFLDGKTRVIDAEESYKDEEELVEDWNSPLDYMNNIYMYKAIDSGCYKYQPYWSYYDVQDSQYYLLSTNDSILLEEKYQKLKQFTNKTSQEYKAILEHLQREGDVGRTDYMQKKKHNYFISSHDLDKKSESVPYISSSTSRGSIFSFLRFFQKKKSCSLWRLYRNGRRRE